MLWCLQIKDLEEQVTADKSAQDDVVSTATVALTAQLAKKEKVCNRFCSVLVYIFRF